MRAAAAMLAVQMAWLRVVTGAVLSVFSPGESKTLRTSTATIGIRGTAVYLEAEESRTYVCTCYGEAGSCPRPIPRRGKPCAPGTTSSRAT